MASLKDSWAKELRKKLESKAGTILSDTSIILPDREIIEQASSEATARYAASLCPEKSVVADLTAGMGVNSIMFSFRASKVYSIERNRKRADALMHNLEVTGIENIEIICRDCIEWLENNSIAFDLAFADPSRRDAEGKRIVDLHCYSPDISQILTFLPKNKCKTLLVKISPLYDIDLLFEKFGNLSTVHIVEYRREVKELLLEFILTDSIPPKSVKIIIIKDNGEETTIRTAGTIDRLNIQPIYLRNTEEIVGGFLYEPSPGMIKAGKYAESQYIEEELKKLSPNTQLYYSANLCSDFPGRVFQIIKPLGSKDLKKLKGGHYGVISRNHPAKAAELEKRFKLIPNEKHYIIACTIANSKNIYLAQKL